MDKSTGFLSQIEGFNSKSLKKVETKITTVEGKKVTIMVSGVRVVRQCSCCVSNCTFIKLYCTMWLHGSLSLHTH